jgi:hypothetical protein
VIRRGAALAFLVVAIGCGKKGPPLPPLVRLPAAPTDFSIARRASEVVVQLKVPTTNGDGSTPADLDRIEIFVVHGETATTPQAIIRAGTKVGTIVVNPPVDPDASQDEVEKAKAAAPPGGVDQGAVATVTDTATLSGPGSADAPAYFAVGVNTRGRRGALTRRIAVPLGELLPPPSDVTARYDETSITLTWPAAPEATYHVYNVEADTALTKSALAEPAFVDHDMKWDTERCYVVRAVRVVDDVRMESEASPRACVTPKDTFPPKAPGGLQAIAAEGAVNLIWDPNNEADLAGYLVLRAISPQTTPEPIDQKVITETTFRDTVPSNSRVIYAVQAVDKNGNRSPMSAFVEETVR